MLPGETFKAPSMVPLHDHELPYEFDWVELQEPELQLFPLVLPL
jgi:hypothetical protein